MLWLVSELYFPEEAATGYYMTLLAEGLAGHSKVGVICCQPRYGRDAVRAPWRENRHGVTIRRCRSTTFNKDRFLGRACNAFTSSLSMFFMSLRLFRPGDTVLVVTNPPSLPFVIAEACRWRRARCCLRIDDVYPEAMVNAGLLEEGGLPTRCLGAVTARLYRRMHRIVVLGRDMHRLVKSRLNGASDRVEIIPNWADTEEVQPQAKSDNRTLKRLGLLDKFVVGYAGNLGPLQAIDCLFASAIQLRQENDVHFLIAGSGRRSAWLNAAVAESQLKNICLLGQRPRREQQDFLNACDVAVISLVRGMAGVGVPSRLYNMLAAGKPIIASVDSDSEIAQVVREEQIGWVVPPEDPAALATAILSARRASGELAQMGRRARCSAQTKYTRELIVAAYRRVFAEARSECVYAGPLR